MRRIARRRRYLTNVAAALFSVVVLVWTFTPIYNMVMVAFERRGRCLQRAYLAGENRRSTASGSSSPRATGIWSISGTSLATASISPP